MSRKKNVQLESTLPYFKEFEKYGDYIPDTDNLKSILQERFDTHIVSYIGHGASGIAYLLENDDVLKITTNKQEGKVAIYLMQNPNPNVAEYKYVWKEGDLHYIVMERIDYTINKHPLLLVLFNIIKRNLEEQECYNPECAVEIVRDMQELKAVPFAGEIEAYIYHLSKSEIRIFDFLNPDNIGVKGNKIKFFDIT